jgi:hypothetical protein
VAPADEAARQAAQPPQPPAPASVVLPKRKTSPFVWLLIVLLTLLILCGMAATVAVAVVTQKTGLSVKEIASDPAYAFARTAMADNPDLEEIGHSGGAITLRNRRTGKTTTVRFGDLRNGAFHFSAEGEDGKRATVEIGEGAKRLPSWVPVYPGAEASGGLSAMGDDGEKLAEGGTVVYSTPDPAGAVFAFYEEKARATGMRVETSTRHAAGGILVMKDDDRQRTLTVLLGGGSGHTTISLTYGGKQ